MKESDVLKKIFVSVTTFQSNWQKQIDEVNKLKLKEISLFLTCSGIRERNKIYNSLDQSSIKSIPHVPGKELQNKSFYYTLSLH